MTMSEKHDAKEGGSIGRIEVVPEILITIAQRAALRTHGVMQLAEIPSTMTRRFSRHMRRDGILLELSENGTATFDLFVIMDANVNIMDASRKLQASIVEGIDNMVGIPVNAVNIHVEDVIYPEP
jgi:uncharacterized alkaline shock family protein YloU